MELICIAALVAAMASAQQPATTPPATGNTPVQQQRNAASATQDNSGTSGDQITKPANAKGSTLIGCLTGPNKEGKFLLRNMAHRSGVQVLGSDDLKNDSGSKVKLTGQWQPMPAEQQQKPSTESRRFQITDLEVLDQSCRPPSETTPVSKNKPQKPTTYNAPNSDNSH